MNSNSTTLKTRLFTLGARSLPKILTLQDRNPHSPTYGCFDRNFWHLRITDFPSGMAQEFVLPLALAYAHDFVGNRFYGNATIRECARAGIAYAAQSAHPDGSCDDYYPFEKAAGASAFSLYAMLETIALTGIDAAPFLPFFKRRGRWLAEHEESGRLSNHEALIANCLYRLADMTGDDSFAKSGRSRLDRLLTWQSNEGWFIEYNGSDPGYLTLTIANMAEIDAARPELGLRPPLTAAVRFLQALQPPDGWMGGEWTSRNTNNYFPHGLEIVGTWLVEALEINTRAVTALDPAPEYDDDHILGHHSWSYLKAALNWVDDRPAPTPRGEVNFPEAGYLTLKRGTFTLLVALKKGGSFRLYEGKTLIHSDTGVSVQRREGRKTRNYVCHLWTDDPHIERSANGVTLSGSMGRAKTSQMTPVKSMVLRTLMLTLGRFNPDLIRRMLQRLLITGAPSSPLSFERALTLSNAGLEIRDRVNGPGRIVGAGFGPAQTSIYTVMSRVYHPSQLQPWTDLSDRVAPGKGLRIDVTRHLPDQT